MNRRRITLAAGGFFAAFLSGCVYQGRTRNTPTNKTTIRETETDTTETETQTKKTETSTEAPPDPTDLSDEPNYDISIIAQNFADSAEELTVLVMHTDTEKIVYEEIVMLEPGEDHEVFHFEDIQGDYGGVESFKLSASLANGSLDEETIGTNECYGNARIDIGEGGELQVYYSIC